MYHSVPRPDPQASELPLLVRLFRAWTSARLLGDNPLPEMARVTGNRMETLTLASACDSFFALTEACIERRLIAGGAGDAHLSGDEVALLETIRETPLLTSLGPNSRVPHGLPGALQWAAMSVLQALGEDGWEISRKAGVVEGPVQTCPFARSPHRIGRAA
ncbi:hypothetical protein [Alteraurantiacibacter aquimixticola]|uniref:Uncharacterized protein n=1 Tax=Alteraurantiacibacter aquimixticola TaxID=2489173 RepID=A0A4T3F3F6_9SPHN|nr:hypothetical protein [Alteraurantiacibacter aquimixticola]TIX51698.1 hypothetical protein E5222_04405 [Alteraurantiacibacter aquimixticola]